MALTQVTPDVVHNIQSNITQVGTLSALTVTGNISSGNVIATNFTGTASLANNASFLGGTPAASYALGSAVTTANTNMKGYVDGQISTTSSSITTANTNMKGYVDGQISTTTTANTNMKGYVDGQISTTSSAITTANTNMKGYVDAANTIQSGQISTTSSSITTANTNMKGYVDAVTTAWTANAGAQAASIASKANTTTVDALTTAKGYISFRPSDGAVFASRNLSVSKIAAGNFTITLAAGIQNGTVNYAPIVTAISRGHEIASAFTTLNLEVYGVGIFSITSSNFTVLANSNYNTGLFYAGGNDGNEAQQFAAALFDPARITVVVF